MTSTQPLPPSSPFKGSAEDETLKREKKPTPVVTYLLVVANVVIFVAAPILMNGYKNVIFTFGFTPANILALKNLYSFITHMFIHVDVLHILMNMLVLFMFARDCERKLRKLQFLLFYLVCGILAISTHFLFYAASDIPVIGASGAIYGVLGAYAMLFPTKKVYVVLGYHVPAILGILLVLLIQLLHASLTPHIAHLAHIGGFIAGITVIRLVRPETAGFLPKLTDTILSIFIPDNEDSENET